MALRVLGPGDELALDDFLARHADSSMFLRSNARAAGLLDRGQRLQGTYVAALADGAIAAVAAHCWNGVVLVQAPVHLAAVVREAVRRSGRSVTGLSGPWPQVEAARAVVAGALLAGRKEGVRRAVLFADPANRSARAAYEALGFKCIGDYGLVLFARA